MQLFLKTPIENASGKTFGKKNTVSVRTINGQTYAYTWPEDYHYPVIFSRVKQNLLLRLAQQECNRVYANEEELAQIQQEFSSHPGKYHTLRGYLFALCRARVADQVTDEMVQAEMQRRLSSPRK